MADDAHAQCLTAIWNVINFREADSEARSAVSSRLPVPSLPRGRADTEVVRALSLALVVAFALALDCLLAESYQGACTDAYAEEGGRSSDYIDWEHLEEEKEQDEAGCRDADGLGCRQ